MAFEREGHCPNCSKGKCQLLVIHRHLLREMELQQQRYAMGDFRESPTLDTLWFVFLGLRATVESGIPTLLQPGFHKRYFQLPAYIREELEHPTLHVGQPAQQAPWRGRLEEWWTQNQ